MPVPTSSPLPVLLLTAAYGEGHNAAARGLQEALEQQPGVEVKLVDILAETYGAMYQQSRARYLHVIEHHPAWWGFTYQALHRTPLIHAVELSLRTARTRLGALLQQWKPRVVVSTYPLYGYFLQKLYPPGTPRPFRFYTVVTDSLTINSVWHRTAVEAFLVPNEETAAVMRAQKVPETKLQVIGFPVPPCFAQERPERPAPVEGWGRVLYMVNAGRTEALTMAEHLVQLPGAELTIAVGRDEALRTSLEAMLRRVGRTAQVLGWVTNMPELVMSHHILIGKAGGAAVQEAIAALTPMVITKVIPGQEEGNARLLLQHGCAAVCTTPAAVAQEVGRLLADDGAAWHQAVACMSTISRPGSALRMAEYLVAQAQAQV